VEIVPSDLLWVPFHDLVRLASHRNQAASSLTSSLEDLGNREDLLGRRGIEGTAVAAACADQAFEDQGLVVASSYVV